MDMGPGRATMEITHSKPVQYLVARSLAGLATSGAVRVGAREWAQRHNTARLLFSFSTT